ncbi:hypothetical protein B7R74_07530 [Yersinia pseudotuberculosis]|nr:hypothetical protein B7R74_07530 [Yersinia pseudotuberculosis]
MYTAQRCLYPIGILIGTHLRNKHHYFFKLYSCFCILILPIKTNNVMFFIRINNIIMTKKHHIHMSNN